jgi:hypothetical protein
MPEPTVQAFRFIGMPTVRMKEDGSAPGLVVRVPHALGAFFASWFASYSAGNVHMSRFHRHAYAISAKEVR